VFTRVNIYAALSVMRWSKSLAYETFAAPRQHPIHPRWGFTYRSGYLPLASALRVRGRNVLGCVAKCLFATRY
jgi:hypothetical protein